MGLARQRTSRQGRSTERTEHEWLHMPPHTPELRAGEETDPTHTQAAPWLPGHSPP